MTGPIAVRGARPGDTALVHILDMHPRLPFGSNCAANWGLLYNEVGKERITIYELTDPWRGEWRDLRGVSGAEIRLRLHDTTALQHSGRGHTARPCKPPAVQPKRSRAGATAFRGDRCRSRRARPALQHPSRRVRWQCRQLADRPRRNSLLSRLCRGSDAVRRGPHFAQGDGEICGTAIEASLTARIQVWVEPELGVTSPLLETSVADANTSALER